MGTAMPVDITSDIETQGLEPVSSSVDGQSASGRSIDDLLKLQNGLAQQAAIKKRRRGLSMTKLVTPPALSDAGHPNAFNAFNSAGGL